MALTNPNSAQILNKIARNAQMLGLTINSNSGALLNIDDPTNPDIRITCELVTLQQPMAGIDGSASPFLGIGQAYPCVIRMAVGADDNDAADEVIADLQGAMTINVYNVLRIVCGFANNVKLVKENSGAGVEYVLEMVGSVDVLGLGQ